MASTSKKKDSAHKEDGSLSKENQPFIESIQREDSLMELSRPTPSALTTKIEELINTNKRVSNINKVDSGKEGKDDKSGDGSTGSESKEACDASAEAFVKYGDPQNLRFVKPANLLVSEKPII
jgi:hypothetical protein